MAEHTKDPVAYNHRIACLVNFKLKSASGKKSIRLESANQLPRQFTIEWAGGLVRTRNGRAETIKVVLVNGGTEALKVWLVVVDCNHKHNKKKKYLDC